MADQKMKVLGVCAVIGIGFAACQSSIADDRKRAEGDDFTDKLEKRFPDEAKRGENSIFRKVKESGQPKTAKPQPKPADNVAEVSGNEGATAEEGPMVEKPKSSGGVLGGFLKKLGGDDDDDEVVASVIEEDEEDPSTTKTELPPVTKLPAATVTKDGIKQFASWDDVPYKRQDTVDKMLDKLQVKTPAKKTMPRLPLPGPRPVPPTTTTSEKPEKEEKKAPVISDN